MNEEKINDYDRLKTERKKVMTEKTIEETLKERGGNYGSFMGNATISQNIKAAMKLSPNWEKLSFDKKEALEMVAHKIARILNGDPNFKDSWHDIIGYTKLIDDSLVG